MMFCYQTDGPIMGGGAGGVMGLITKKKGNTISI